MYLWPTVKPEFRMGDTIFHKFHKNLQKNYVKHLPTLYVSFSKLKPVILKITICSKMYI